MTNYMSRREISDQAGLDYEVEDESQNGVITELTNDKFKKISKKHKPDWPGTRPYSKSKM